jgi:hypothetical protein
MSCPNNVNDEIIKKITERIKKDEKYALRLLRYYPEFIGLTDNTGKNIAYYIIKRWESAAKLAVKNINIAKLKLKDKNDRLITIATVAAKYYETAAWLVVKNMEIAKLENSDGSTAAHVATHFHNPIANSIMKNIKIALLTTKVAGGWTVAHTAVSYHPTAAHIVIQRAEFFLKIRDEHGVSVLTVAAQTLDAASKEVAKNTEKKAAE